LRLDVLTVITVPLYYLIFFAIYGALKPSRQAILLLSTLLAFIGITLFLSAPSTCSIVFLSDKYAAASSPEVRQKLLAAGEALIASDMWHHIGALAGGILMQSSAVVISALMLRTKVFSNLITYVGILVHGLDLIHIVVGLLLPSAGVLFMAVAGPLYLIWFPLLGHRLWQLGNQVTHTGGD
jgi:hypothetical protein